MKHGKRDLTAEQQQQCARCGAIKWFHEPGRAWDTDHAFTTAWRPWEAQVQAAIMGEAKGRKQ